MEALQNLEPGTRLSLSNGRRAIVVENPRDGAWLVVQSLAVGANAAAPDANIEYCSFDDVVGIEP